MNSKKDLRLLSNALDSKFKIGNFRFGYDGLIGLIPVVGDAVTMSLSMYIILRAILMRYPSSIIIKMVVNVLIENIIGLIPVLGNIFDFGWKSNVKNITILDKYDLNPEKTLKTNRRKLMFMLIFLICFFILSFYLLIKLAAFIFAQIF